MLTVCNDYYGIHQKYPRNSCFYFLSFYAFLQLHESGIFQWWPSITSIIWPQLTSPVHYPNLSRVPQLSGKQYMLIINLSSYIPTSYLIFLYVSQNSTILGMGVDKISVNLFIWQGWILLSWGKSVLNQAKSVRWLPFPPCNKKCCTLFNIEVRIISFLATPLKISAFTLSFSLTELIILTSCVFLSF